MTARERGFDVRAISTADGMFVLMPDGSWTEVMAVKDHLEAVKELQEQDYDSLEQWGAAIQNWDKCLRAYIAAIGKIKELNEEIKRLKGET